MEIDVPDAKTGKCDGLLDKDEVRALLRLLGVDADDNKVNFQEIWDNLDSNKDGKVDFEEFHQWMVFLIESMITEKTQQHIKKIVELLGEHETNNSECAVRSQHQYKALLQHTLTGGRCCRRQELSNMQSSTRFVTFGSLPTARIQL